MNNSIELIRIIAVVLICFTHIRHDFTDGFPYLILEEIPKYGTLILSVISGFLYAEYSQKKTNLLKRKIKSLLIPYLIANLMVLLPILIFNYLGFNFLNRLDYGVQLFTEGLCSLNSPPINPPTYFVRDLFIVFCIFSLLKKEWFALIFLLPLLLFGKILLREDILFLFLFGYFFSKYQFLFKRKKLLINVIFLSLLFLSLIFFEEYDLTKYFLTFLIFINLISLKFNFIKTGAYTYTLHLFHSPIIVFSYVFISKFVTENWILAITQILFAIIFSYLVYFLLKFFKIKIITGGR